MDIIIAQLSTPTDDREPGVASKLAKGKSERELPDAASLQAAALCILRNERDWQQRQRHIKEIGVFGVSEWK